MFITQCKTNLNSNLKYIIYNYKDKRWVRATNDVYVNDGSGKQSEEDKNEKVAKQLGINMESIIENCKFSNVKSFIN